MRLAARVAAARASRLIGLLRVSSSSTPCAERLQAGPFQPFWRLAKHSWMGKRKYYAVRHLGNAQYPGFAISPLPLNRRGTTCLAFTVAQVKNGFQVGVFDTWGECERQAGRVTKC